MFSLRSTMQNQDKSTSLLARKRRHGPAPLALDERREHCVSVRLNREELASLDAARGRLARGEWLRMASLNPAKLAATPRAPDPIALDQWRELARIGSNLNQLAHALNSARLSGVEAGPKIEDIRAALIDLRAALLCAKAVEVEA
jgi:hypothetical protein